MSSVCNERMLRVADAAAILNLSISTLNKLRCSGDGPPYMKIGRAVLYEPNDLNSWLAGRRRHSTSDEEVAP